MEPPPPSQSSSGELSEPSPHAYSSRYRIDDVIGRGGMGEVYRAYDTRLHRVVALKRILAAHETPRARARLWREARLLAGLKHPGIVALHDIVEGEDGALLLAMELVEGTPLSAMVGEPWDVPRALAVAHGLAAALGHAHASTVVHRDVKPSNLILQPDGQVRLIDFGLARREDDVGLTREGAMIGTLGYMAPEQVTGDPTTAAADVFAVGSILYHLLVGVGPFTRDSREATVAALLGNVHVPLGQARAGLPPELVALVERCLAPLPTDRPRDGKALASALDRIGKALGLELGPELLRADGMAVAPRRSRSRLRWGIALLAGGAVGVVGGVVIAEPTSELPCGPVAPIVCDERTLACKQGRPPPAGLVHWVEAGALKGVAPGDPIARWPDRGPKALDLVQHDPKRQPLLHCDAPGARPVVRMDGLDDRLESNVDFPLTGDAEFTAFTVLRLRESQSKVPVIWNWGVPSFGGAGSNLQLTNKAIRWETGFYHNATPPDEVYADRLGRLALVTVTRAKGPIAASTTIEYDGVEQKLTGSELVPEILAAPLSVGGWRTQPADVDLAELIVYDYPLHVWAREEIACWLGAKYGIEVARCEKFAPGVEGQK